MQQHPIETAHSARDIARRMGVHRNLLRFVGDLVRPHASRRHRDLWMEAPTICRVMKAHEGRALDALWGPLMAAWDAAPPDERASLVRALRDGLRGAEWRRRGR